MTFAPDHKTYEEQLALWSSTRTTGLKDSFGTAVPNFAKPSGGRISRAVLTVIPDFFIQPKLGQKGVLQTVG